MTPLNIGLIGSGALGAVGATFVLLLVCGLLLLAAVPAILAFVVLSRVPPQFRKQEPGLVFLLLIPVFSMIWAFFVHPRVAESLKAYYTAQNDATVGDCGASVALWLCICHVCVYIPVLNMIAGPAALILLIIFYVKAFELSARIPKTP